MILCPTVCGSQSWLHVCKYCYNTFVVSFFEEQFYSNEQSIQVVFTQFISGNVLVCANSVIIPKAFAIMVRQDSML